MSVWCLVFGGDASKEGWRGAEWEEACVPCLFVGPVTRWQRNYPA